MTGQQERRAIGQRVRAAMEARFGTARTQTAVAADLGMTSDAFSRSLNGERAFSSAELARAAHLLGADLHALITGTPDPLRAAFAARHAFDRETYEYRNDGEDADAKVRDGVLLAYRQANPWLAASNLALPSTAAACRALLGEGFAPMFADHIEERLGVDVVRLPGLSTDYSLTIAEQRIILLGTQGNWFRANWSLAHELGHLCLGHHEVDATDGSGGAEGAANAFAAELLLPAAQMRTFDWTALSPAEVAEFVWDAGVSTATLRNRLQSLGLPVSADVAGWLSQSTQRFLNHHPVKAAAARPLDDAAHHFITVIDPIGQRMQRASERRVPARLMKGLRDGIEAGRLNSATLAWLLDVKPETLEIDQPEPPADLGVDEVADLLGF